MSPLTATVVTLAQVAPTPPDGGRATAASASISLLLLVCLAGWYCVKYKGAQWPHILTGVAIGVLGSGTVIGTFVWSLLDIMLAFLEKLGEMFPTGNRPAAVIVAAAYALIR